ncbi:unnamed protein product [Leptosia nina]|uniref:DUF5641 domain-containing protein n=1 Tax=Leptosia nina TaxID=320188 RepID=A0AAV1JUN7_9NEOP
MFLDCFESMESTASVDCSYQSLSLTESRSLAARSPRSVDCIHRAEVHTCGHLIVTEPIAVTAQYVNEFQIRFGVLSTEEVQTDHSAVNIAQAVLNILAKWNITNKIVTVVTDNAANKKITEHLHKYHRPCVTHTRNLSVQHSIKENPFLETLLSKSRSLVTYFKQSNLAAYKLREIQHQMALQELKLKQDILTRWNSAVIMMERLSQMKLPLSAALSSLPNAPKKSRSDWEAIDDCVQFFKLILFMTKRQHVFYWYTGTKPTHGNPAIGFCYRGDIVVSKYEIFAHPRESKSDSETDSFSSTEESYIAKMEKFDLRTATSLLPELTGEEMVTKKLIDGIDLYSSMIDQESQKKIINFILKTRCTENAKTRLANTYESCNLLLIDMKKHLLTKKSSTAIHSEIMKAHRGTLSLERYGQIIESLMVNLTVAQADDKPESYGVLQPVYEKIAIQRFVTGLRNKSLTTILAARNDNKLKDVIRAAKVEEVTVLATDLQENMFIAKRRTVFNNSHTWLIDTGASVSAVKYEIAERWTIPIRNETIQHFWNPWSTEYVVEDTHEMASKNAESTRRRHGYSQGGQSTPMKWRIGRVHALYPGSDGITRVVDVRTSAGVIGRALSRLCLLPIQELKKDS